MTYTKLPYDFDLHFDIKSVEELHRVLIEDSLESYHDEDFLYELIKHYNIPLPDGFEQPIKDGFPKVVWIDRYGCYYTYCPEDKENYQRMRRG